MTPEKALKLALKYYKMRYSHNPPANVGMGDILSFAKHILDWHNKQNNQQI